MIQINPNREQTMFPDAFAGLTAMIHLDSSNWNWPATRLLSPTAYRRSNPMAPISRAGGRNQQAIRQFKMELARHKSPRPGSNASIKEAGGQYCGRFYTKKVGKCEIML